MVSAFRGVYELDNAVMNGIGNVTLEKEKLCWIKSPYITKGSE